MWWLRSYCIVVFKNGDQLPIMNIAPNKYDPIKYVFHRDLTNSSSVFDKISIINNLTPETEPVILTAEDKCDIIINHDNALVKGYFDEFEDFDIPTKELLKLFEEWHEFLKAYEMGEIPGIIPVNRRDQLLIVPMFAIKEEYLKDKK